MRPTVDGAKVIHPPNSMAPIAPVPLSNDTDWHPADVDPVSEWTYAPSADGLHEIWVDRFEIAARDAADAQGLLPYADAIVRYGSSWGIRPEEIRFVFQDEQGSIHAIPLSGHAVRSTQKSLVLSGPEQRELLGAEGLPQQRELRVGIGETGLRAVGALIARESCRECHDYSKGAAVGALVYQFREIADD